MRICVVLELAWPGKNVPDLGIWSSVQPIAAAQSVQIGCLRQFSRMPVHHHDAQRIRHDAEGTNLLLILLK